MNSRRDCGLKKSVFAKELRDLNEITVKENALLEQLTARVRPTTHANQEGQEADKRNFLTYPAQRRQEI